MLKKKPEERFSAEEILNHFHFKNFWIQESFSDFEILEK